MVNVTDGKGNGKVNGYGVGGEKPNQLIDAAVMRPSRVFERLDGWDSGHGVADEKYWDGGEETHRLGVHQCEAASAGWPLAPWGGKVTHSATARD